MTSKNPAIEIVTTGCGLFVSLGLVTDGYQEFERGAPMAEWVPLLSLGLIVGLFLVAMGVASRVGEDPETTEGFPLALQAATGTFVLTTAAGVAYVTANFTAILSWGHVVIGFGGLLVMGWAWLRTAS
ncbi:hypothetical protein SAMN05216559_0408 [Halomicrobium zhouii]|uniref:Uncharacterized protein n=1 Tax=Halomicrobium zhouii TaxID=767519 RepID=A0A1I6K9I6_9EURY|nr:hypothetical protein [Halomicrobium zhouii]SFR87804.1 hypothetical protein SAMN05216559_0408 [Halomicrobium zhouii]